MTATADVVVSVVVPCFNQGRYLSDCLESLLSQDMTSWEAIVVDDASTEDDIRDIVRMIDEPRIRVISHASNRGLGAARNSGFRAARAELVLPLDSDDELEPSFLSSTAAALEDSPDADCAFTDFQLFGASDEVWRYSGRHSLGDMLDRQWIPGPGTLMKRSVWHKVGGYAETKELAGNEDWDFWIAALGAGLKWVHLPAPLYRYRRHPASLSVWMPSVDYAQRECIYRRHREIFDLHHAGGRFRALGYLNSAVFSWRAGRRLDAARLLARGLTIPGGARPILAAAGEKALRDWFRVGHG